MEWHCMSTTGGTNFVRAREILLIVVVVVVVVVVGCWLLVVKSTSILDNELLPSSWLFFFFENHVRNPEFSKLLLATQLHNFSPGKRQMSPMQWHQNLQTFWPVKKGPRSDLK